jgi:hypothetical protein
VPQRTTGSCHRLLRAWSLVRFNTFGPRPIVGTTVTVLTYADTFLDEQTAGSLVRNSFRVFFGTFTALWPMNALFVGPGSFLQLRGEFRQDAQLTALGIALIILGSVPASIAMAIAISDACLGHQVNLKRAFRVAVGRTFWSVLLTTVLTMTLFGLGLVLLIVPGLFFISWFMFVQPAVVIEKLGPLEAFSRSKQLGKGFYVRNVAVLLLLIFITYVAYLTSSVIVGVLAALIASAFGQSVITELIASAVLTAMLPLQAIPMILLYYDMRARKEGLDRTRLLEELRT